MERFKLSNSIQNKNRTEGSIDFFTESFSAQFDGKTVLHEITAAVTESHYACRENKCESEGHQTSMREKRKVRSRFVILK